jgi:glycosyltransferase involved in cell wall biosynthesis
MNPTPAPPAPIDVSVLIPVCNEEEGIDRCFVEITRVLDSSGLGYELVFVDDGSSDRSWERMEALAAPSDRVLLVKLRRNAGQQVALWAGLPHCRGEVVVTLDADLQCTPECIPLLVAQIRHGHDIAGGIRVDRRDSLLLNRLPSWCGRFLINHALGISQQDFGAVKAYRRDLVERIARLPPDHLVIPAAAYALSRRFVEVPIAHAPRRQGVSKWSLEKRARFFLDLYLAYALRPFDGTLLAGLVAMMAGLAALLWSACLRPSGPPDPGAALLVLEAILMMAGVQLATLALIGESAARAIRACGTGTDALVERIVGGPAPPGGAPDHGSGVPSRQGPSTSLGG